MKPEEPEKKEEVEADKTESEVAALKNVVEKPKEVKENYISQPAVGINKFKE